MRVISIFALVALSAGGLCATTPDEVGGCRGTIPIRTLQATPADYLSIVATLAPGDLLQLAAGTYPSGLSLWNLDGSQNNCIIIEGPDSGPAAVFTGRDCCNTVNIGDSSYLVIRNLELDGQGRWGDGVKADGGATQTHHITIENLYIHDHDIDQQVVGINTKCASWNWVIRNNIIESTGTGIYLGDSNGTAEFVAGLIEYNLVLNTTGYNMQVKHQHSRNTGLGIPASADTIIRHNVFSKAANGSTGNSARPNLLVGHWPLTGDGFNDNYLIYGNFFFENPNEALFQGEGNVIFHQNLLVNNSGSAVNIQAHNDVPRRIRVFSNTVLALGGGISISSGDPSYQQRVIGNASFAASPISGGVVIDNITNSYAAAGAYLSNPFGAISGVSNRLDLFPLPSALYGTPIDLSGLSTYEDWDVDFNGAERSGTFRGAYSGEGSNPGWQLALERKPETALFADGFESGNTAAWSAVAPAR